MARAVLAGVTLAMLARHVVAGDCIPNGVLDSLSSADCITLTASTGCGNPVSALTRRHIKKCHAHPPHHACLAHPCHSPSGLMRATNRHVCSNAVYDRC
jgi:hypothetical protein